MLRYDGVDELLGSHNGTVSIALQNYALGRFVLVGCCAISGHWNLLLCCENKTRL